MTRHLTAAVILLVASFASPAPGQTTQPTPRLSAALQQAETAAQQDVAARAAEVQAAADKVLAEQRAYAVKEYAAVAERLAAATREVERLRAATQPSTQPVPSTQPARYAVKSRVGVMAVGSPLANVVKTGNSFGPFGQPWRKDVPQPKLDADGWPLEDASVQAIWDVAGAAGEYTLKFTGKATVNAFHNATVTGYAHDPATDTSRARVTVRPLDPAKHGDLVELCLNFKDTAGGVRDVELYRVEHEGLYLNPDWVKAHEPFGVHRHMDGQRTNVSTWLTGWDKRPRLGQQTYRHTGFPLEVFRDVANATGSAPYVCLPIWADADYDRRALEFLRDGVRRDIPINVESSNEDWNDGIGTVKGYWAAKATTNGVTDWTMRHRLPLRRAAERARLAREIFEDQPGRLRFVVGVQAANFWRDSANLNWLEQDQGVPLDALFHRIGIAPYVGTFADSAAMRLLTAPAQVAAFLLGKVAEPPRADWLKWRDFARAKKLKPLLYEAGTEWPQDAANAAARAASQRLPAAGEFVTRYFDKMANEVGAEEMLWNSSVDNWSVGKPYALTDNVRDLTGPKYRAAVEAARKYPGN